MTRSPIKPRKHWSFRKALEKKASVRLLRNATPSSERTESVGKPRLRSHLWIPTQLTIRGYCLAPPLVSSSRRVHSLVCGSALIATSHTQPIIDVALANWDGFRCWFLKTSVEGTSQETGSSTQRWLRTSVVPCFSLGPL